MSAREIVSRLQQVLLAARLPLHDEKALQQRMADCLSANGIAHEREVRLDMAGRDIVDFLVGGVAVEVKIKGQRRAIARQLERYASHPQVEALMLVTSRSVALPAAINDRPVFCFALGASWL